MKVGLDTSVVLRLLVGEPEDQVARAKSYLDELARQGKKPVISDMVMAEVYFAAQYHYGVPKKDALDALAALLAEGEIENLGVAAEILNIGGVATAKPGFIDRLIHRQYLEECGTMATFEKAAAKLGDVRVV